MNEDHMEPSTSTSTSTPTIAADPPPPAFPTSSSSTPLLLHPRREPFEHGLLPIPKLIFADGTLTLDSLKRKLLSHAPCVNAPVVADALQIPIEQAALVIDTLASITVGDGGRVEGTADVYDLLLFLYIQTYKRLLPRTHKDSVAVTDVWPSTSAFDGYLSALSPLQLVRSNSRRSMPSQVDEEAHQLSYLQKHMGNMLSLLAESVEGEGDDLLILSLEQLEHLELLIQFGENGFEGIRLSQAAPFFANSDPDMPATPVSASQVHEWILQNISISLEHTAEKVSAKESGPHAASDVDAAMTDASTNHTRSQSGTSPLESNTGYSRDLTFIEGVSKASVVKQDSDIKGGSLKVLNCHDSIIYILAPLRYATIYGCSDATIVLGAIGKATRVEHCERVHVIVAAKRICIANCRECIFYLGVIERPLVVGDNHNLQVAPYNTFYSRLIEHMNQVHLDPTTNRWNEPLVLGVVDPHHSLSHPSGVSDVQVESATCLDPDIFTNFIIPNWFGDEPSQPTKENPFPLPENYMASLRKHHLVVNEIQQAISGAQLQDNKNRELASSIHIQFKEWLYASGNIRQLYCIQEN